MLGSLRPPLALATLAAGSSRDALQQSAGSICQALTVAVPTLLQTRMQWLPSSLLVALSSQMLPHMTLECCCWRTSTTAYAPSQRSMTSNRARPSCAS